MWSKAEEGERVFPLGKPATLFDPAVAVADDLHDDEHYDHNDHDHQDHHDDEHHDHNDDHDHHYDYDDSKH